MPSAPQNHQDSTEYELIVKSIYEQILKRDGVTNIEVKHNQSIKGKSGVSHQIDVMWRFKQASVEHVVVVECKNFSSTVELGDVRSFKSVLDDLGIARGLMVTKVGYQSGAKDFAKYNGIDLKLVRPPLDSDWNGLVKSIDIHIMLKTFDNSKPPLVKFSVPKHQGEIVAGAVPDGNPTEICLLNREGEAISPPMSLWLGQNVPILDKEAGGPYTYEVRTPETFIRFKREGGESLLVPIDSINVTYHVSELKTDVNVHADEVVTQVLKDFETGDVEHFLRPSPNPK
jgi:hypothetical protein